MFSTDFIFGQQENLVDNQKCQAGFRPLCNIILYMIFILQIKVHIFWEGYCEIFTFLLTVCTAVKSKEKNLQNFVAFSEYMNFKVASFDRLWPHYAFIVISHFSHLYDKEALRLFIFFQVIPQRCQCMSQVWMLLGAPRNGGNTENYQRLRPKLFGL